ncbi:MAG: amidase domain-containing protein, partial [Oscillospiraceae bacterium]|nr:amidase domain-containing protein [Oscillospiraceae bacterium]
MKNRIISFILALSLIAVIMPALSTPSYAAGVYDAGKAVEYSYNNYDKNLGQLCAEFVSNCIKAGGITDVFSKGTGPLINQLLDGGYGTLYKMEISGGELKSNGNNTGKVKPGDVICWYCTNCRKYPHVAIVSKIEKDIVYYNAHNTSVQDGHWIGTYTSPSHSGHKFDVYILSMQTCSHPSYSFKNSSFYCDKCGSEYPIKETTCNEWMDIAKVNGSGTAPAHIKPYGDATISARYSKNDYVNVVAGATNKYGNLWYKLVDGSWLEAGYLTKHTHCYNSDVRCTHCTEGMEIIPLNNVSLTATQSPYTTHLAPYGDAVGVSQTASALTVNAKAVNAYGNIWYRLTNGRWIWSKYVQSPAVDGVVKSSASGGLSFNSKAFAAGTNGSQKLTVIPAGAHITVYPSDKCGHWYSVSYNGVVGYAAGN